ncbi:XI-F [Scenedesmus sp. PABB004]|nr:XI-F [Scenedesmus sp. PABB004]
MAGAATVIHAVGSKVWVKDEAESWVKAEVAKLDGEGGTLIVSTEGSGELRKVKPEDAPLQNVDTRGVEDMTRLSYLHEPGVLWNIKTRYDYDDIYTYTGSILIAVNPFAPLPHIYGPHMMDQYRGADLGDLSPHVYAIADAAYRQMRKELKGQSILVSGESGAGKTETSKLIMKYLAYMGGYMDAAGGSSGGAAPGGGRRRAAQSGRSVEEQVLESNPLLEAFGNAKTVRNNNSSRFGKYVEINFNDAGVISGAAIRTYLLERSRVVSVNNPERSYHIFYQLCDGASAEERARWFLKPAPEFAYLNQSTCFEIPGDSNAEEYERTVSAMSKVGIPAEQREAVFATVAAVLHLGNISFVEGPEPDSSKAAPGSAQEHLRAAAKLLGVDPAGLEHALTTRSRVMREGVIVSPLNVRAAVENRDSLAKVVYAKLFDWLVAAVNAAIGEDPSAAASVGVLDIYGFESFEYNDLEQFCINLANEKLQQHFNQHVFKQEQAEYEREQIDWSYIQFVDNQDVLDLIEGRLGVLDLLDEQCRFPTATHKDLAEKLYGTPSVRDSGRFSKPKLSQTAFTIAHYAGPVTYQTENFLDKNKDFVVAEHQALLEASATPFVRELFAGGEPQAEGEGGKASAPRAAFKFNSVGSQFKRQLGELMAQLHTMEPHYVRCVKPNGLNRPGLFENSNVLHQLRCGGVLEAVRISCAGFPSKRPFPDFVDHFWPLAPELYHTPDLDDRAIAEGVLRASGLEGYQLGTSKVFLRAGQMALLDKQRTEKLSAAATLLQRHARGFLARLHYRQAQAAVLRMQAFARGALARKLVRGLREQRAAVVIQTAWRRHQMRQRYQAVVHTITHLQALWRGVAARAAYAEARRERGALVIQSNWRGAVARGEFAALRGAATTLQNAFRVKAAAAELRHLKSEAREAGKLLEDKKVLETKLKEAQATLELVQGQRNELRQEVKELKAALAEAAAVQQAAAADREAALEAARDEAAAQLRAAQEGAAAAQALLAEAQTAAAAEAARVAGDRGELDKQLKVAQDYIQRLMAEKADLDKRFHGMKDELITRLQNACAQRDEARAQVMELDNRLQKAAADAVKQQDETRKAVAAAAAAAASAPPAAAQPAAPPAAAGAPPAAVGPDGAPLANGDGTVLGSMRKQAGAMLQQAPGYARMLGESLGMAGHPDGAGLGGPEHVPGGYDGRPPHLQETELERKTRELQARDPAAPPHSPAPRGRPARAPPPLALTRRRAAASAAAPQAKQAQLIQEKRKQEEERLLAALAAPMGFHKGKPLAALVVFRACLQWRAFQADRTSVFDRIIQVIGSQIERQQDDNACLAYWLTNTVTLLHLLQRNIKPASGSSGSVKRVAAAAGRSIMGGLFGRQPMGGEASIHGGGVGGFRLVEAKYPALLFKQQLDAFVQKIFPMMRDNVKKAITPMLGHCIHTPRGGHGRGGAALTSRRNSGGAALAGGAGGAGAAADAQSKAWGDILAVFDELLAKLRDNHVPKPLVQALFRQLFSFVNVQLFNQLLLRRECCSFSNGEYVKTGLAQVESWIMERGNEWVGESWDELKFIRQAVTFLVIGNKPKKSLDDITRDLCPVLSIQQLYRISTMYWDDKYNTETVSSEVLGRMKQAMVEHSSSASHSFLLDDDSTLPFAANDILAQMDDKDLYVALPVPDALKGGDGGGSWAFLEKELRFSQM